MRAVLLLLSACGHYSGLPFEDATDNSTQFSGNRRPPQNNNNDDSFAASDPNAVSFVTFGDWGSGSDEQTEVAQAIGDYCLANDCDFILTLGDNFYSNGVDSVNDELWQERFHNVYDFLGLVFYASLGNHDNQGSIQAQIDYTQEVDNWIMLDEHYTFSKPDNATPPLVQFFIINSDWPNFDEAAQTWLGDQLAASQAVWKLLAMHHPIYSNGNHGDGDDDYREALVSIICNRIDLVLSGHDHSFAHMRSDEDGCPIEQLVVGTGGANLRQVDASDPRALASTADIYGFGWFQVSQNQILFRMIDTAGGTFYETMFTNP